MDLTSTDILFGLGAVAAAALVACGVYWISGHRNPAAETAGETAGETAAETPVTDPHGRHRAPEELLRASTYRLTADRIARAKVHVPEQATHSSQAVPSPSRSSS